MDMAEGIAQKSMAVAQTVSGQPSTIYSFCQSSSTEQIAVAAYGILKGHEWTFLFECITKKSVRNFFVEVHVLHISLPH
jgi:hypothetical protein